MTTLCRPGHDDRANNVYSSWKQGNKCQIASLTVQSLTALKSSRHNSFNSFVAEGTWLYFLAEPGEDLQRRFQTKFIAFNSWD